MTSTSFADVAEEEEDEAAAAAAVDFVGGGGPGGRATVGERETRGGGRGRGSGGGARGSGGSGVFRPCLSRASLAASDEGGETDFADQTMSEVRAVFFCLCVRQVRRRHETSEPARDSSRRNGFCFCSCRCSWVVVGDMSTQRRFSEFCGVTMRPPWSSSFPPCLLVITLCPSVVRSAFAPASACASAR